MKKRGWSGKLDPHNKIVKHEQMNVGLCKEACFGVKRKIAAAVLLLETNSVLYYFSTVGLTEASSSGLSSAPNQ